MLAAAMVQCYAYRENPAPAVEWGPPLGKEERLAEVPYGMRQNRFQGRSPAVPRDRAETSIAIDQEDASRLSTGVLEKGQKVLHHPIRELNVNGLPLRSLEGVC